MTAGARTPLGPISCLGNVWVGKCRGTVVGHLGENLFHSKICNPSPPQHPHNPTQHLQYMMLPLWMVICWPFSVCFRGLPLSGNFKTNLGQVFITWSKHRLVLMHTMHGAPLLHVIRIWGLNMTKDGRDSGTQIWISWQHRLNEYFKSFKMSMLT